MHKNRTAFTIVELIIVIAVIGILATISVIGFSRIQSSTRDQQRNSSVGVLVEALEKYYDQNGEYPSCSVMAGSPTVVKDAIGVDADVLKAPKSTNSNSVTCADITGATTADVFAYIGDGTGQCATGLACVSYTLKYKEEATGEIREIKSRRTGTIATAPVAPASATTTTFGGENVLAQATDALCPGSSTQYRIDFRTNGGAWSEGEWGTQKTRSQASNQGNQYSYRTSTRCVLNDGTLGVVVTGNTDDEIRPIVAPSPPVLVASKTGTGSDDSVTWSWGAVTCPATTSVRYSTAYSRDDATLWRAWSANTTSASYPLATNYQGYEYKVKARALCMTSYVASSYSNDSNAPAYTRSVAAPGVASGFHIDISNNAINGGGTYQRASFWWDVTPTCGTGATRLVQSAGWNNQWRNGGPVGGGGAPIFQIDANTPRSDLGPSPDTGATDAYLQQEYRWRTAWQSDLLPRYSDPAQADSLDDTNYWKNITVTSANRLYTGGYVVADGAYIKGARAYVRYACVNTTTDRGAIGAPALSNWYQY